MHGHPRGLDRLHLVLSLLGCSLALACSEPLPGDQRAELDSSIEAGDGDTDGGDGGDGDTGVPKLMISEVDYDQPGEDDAEFIELYNAGTGTASLAGLELMLGTSEGSAPYSVFEIDDLGSLEPGEYLVLAAPGALSELELPTPRIPLGDELDQIDNVRSALSPGGGGAMIMLRDDTRDVLLDWVGYEGTVALASGALDEAFTDEDEPTLAVDDEAYGAGGTLCRWPQGARSAWTTCTEPTPGAANVRAPRVLINEVDAKHGSNELYEYVELVNTGTAGLHLRGIYLAFVNANGSLYRTVDFEPAGVLAARGYAVVGSERAVEDLALPNAIIDLGYQSDWIQHEDPAGIALVDGITGKLLDAVSYNGSIPTALLPEVGVVSLVEGEVLTAIDTGAETTLCRSPDATDTDDAASDWSQCSAPSVGYANIPE